MLLLLFWQIVLDVYKRQDLAGIPVLAADRSENDPLIIAGGPCVYNPEPLADFIDFFVIGEGEEMNLEVYDLVAKMKASSSGKDEILLAVKDIPGVYVPSLYTDSYKADGRFDKLSAHDNAPETVKKRILTDMDSAPFPDKPLLPSVKPVHDRICLLYTSASPSRPKASAECVLSTETSW